MERRTFGSAVFFIKAIPSMPCAKCLLWHNGPMALENFFRMDKVHKRLNSDELTHPVTDEEMELGEHDRTLAQIMQDKKEQDRFINKFCAEQDEDEAREVTEALAGGNPLTPEQDKFLEKMRVEYNRRRAEAEKVHEMLPKYMERIASLDPRIQEVVGKIGLEKTAELLGHEFENLALEDTRKFNKTVKEMQNLHDLDTSPIIENLNRHVEQTLGKYGIDEEKYWEATREGETWRTQSRLQTLAEENLHGFKYAIDFLTFNSISKRRGRELYKTYGEQSAVLKECDKHMKAIGRVLQGTLNKDLRLAIQKAMLEGGEVKEKKVENNITTFAEYQNAKQDLETRQSRWQQYKQDEIKRMNIKDISKQPDALEGIKNRFTELEYQKQKGYRPARMFAVLIALLFGTGTKDDIKNSLK